MRCYNLGAFYRVTYNETDAYAFNRQFPCGPVYGHGGYTFDAHNGDIVSADGSAYSGPDGNGDYVWLAWSLECQAYGDSRLGYNHAPDHGYNGPGYPRARKNAAGRKNDGGPQGPPGPGWTLYIGGSTTARADKANGRTYATKAGARRAARRIVARYGALVSTAWIVRADGAEHDG